jgi:UDP-glucose 4-epimerase
MSKVLVTGGAGFVGSNLVRHLLSDGRHDVVVVDDFSTGMKSNLEGLDVQIFEEDISNPAASIFSTKDKYETIVHLAARGSVPRSIKNPIATTSTNVLGTQNLLELARKNSSHFIFSSSSSVYGKNLQLPKVESDWIHPLTPYAASKAAAEAYVLAYSNSFGIPISLFRFFNIFGPWQRPDHVYSAVIPKWIWKAMQNQSIEIFGDGEQTRDFTFISTVTDTIETAITHKKTFDGTINLAFGNRVSLNELTRKLQIEFPNLEILYTEPRLGDVIDSQNDPSLLHSLFPNVIPRSFDTGLGETIDWFKEYSHQIINGPSVID